MTTEGSNADGGGKSGAEISTGVERKNHESTEEVSLTPEVEVRGFVGAGGVVGMRWFDEPYKLSAGLAGWRCEGDPPQDEELSVQMLIAETELDAFQDMMEPYTFVRLRCRLERAQNRRMYAIATEISHLENDDEELEQLRVKAQLPVTMNDPVLGEFVLDRRRNTFEGTISWGGEIATLKLSSDSTKAALGMLATAKELLKDQQTWDTKVKACAVEHLLELKNTVWQDDDDDDEGSEAEAVTAEEFAGRMKLNSVSIDKRGAFQFWYDDGDLFFGHAIEVSGNLRTGVKRADIAG